MGKRIPAAVQETTFGERLAQFAALPATPQSTQVKNYARKFSK